MSRDITIFSRHETNMPLDEIRAAMRKRGAPVDFFFTSPAGAKEPERWREGSFRPEGDSNPAHSVSVSALEFSPRQRERLKASLPRLADPAGGEALLASRSYYHLAVPFRMEPALARILAELVDILAEWGGGPIEDSATDLIHDRVAYLRLLKSS